MLPLYLQFENGEYARVDTNKNLTVDDRLKHIAFIMDGNGRWANKRGMPREFGHKKVLKFSAK